jgi:hypothetical protein
MDIGQDDMHTSTFPPMKTRPHRYEMKNDKKEIRLFQKNNTSYLRKLREKK